MPHRNDRLTSGEDVNQLEKVLDDAPLSGHTRATIVKRAAIGVAAAAPAAGLLAAGPASAWAQGSGDSIKTVGTVAVTAEALAVTYLTTVLEKNENVHAFPRPVVEVLRAADTAEFDHFRFLRGAGFKPLTTTFWIPDDAFGRRLRNVAPTIEVAETLFVNAYLIGVTVFAGARNATLARYAAEICGVESEHRALARQLQGKLPDNLAFEQYSYTRLSQIVGALEGAGFGFGQRGSKPGRFYQLKQGISPGDEYLNIDNDTPR
jgi:Ferritin-like domain